MKNKHLPIIITTLFCANTFAQTTQRTVLIEEFTQASCGPCAAQNPAFNALLSNNLTKVVSLKYQTSWPGVDPMNAQNPTEVATRVAYYNVSGVPNVAMDGVEPGNGLPSAVDQAGIDANYTVPSEVKLNIQHSFSATYDSAFIKVVYENVSGTAFSALKLHLALTEKTIVFTAAPGNNGELDFYNVMRKMIPGAAGTTISIAANAKDSLTFKIKLPAYLYDLSEIEFVTFIQDANKAVLQAAKTDALLFANDAKMLSVSGLPTSPTCDSIFNVDFTIKNNGTQNINSATINYVTTGGTLQTTTFTSLITPGSTAIFTVNNYLASKGSVRFTGFVKSPNASSDINYKNDSAYTTSSTFAVATPITTTSSINENFSTVFPPTNWIVEDKENDNLSWRSETRGSGGLNTFSARIRFYDIPAGSEDNLYVKTLSLAGLTDASIGFKVAAAQYSINEEDELQLETSTDCGVTWNNIWSKKGADLATAPIITSSYVPTGAAQWRQELASLTTLAGLSNIIVRFRALGDFGNNAFIDNVNIYSGTPIGLNNLINTSAIVSVYPNPAKDNVTIKTENIQINTIQFVNNLGKIVKSVETISKENNINVLDLPSGLYTVKIIGNDGIKLQKLILQK